MNSPEPQAIRSMSNPFSGICREIQQAQHLPGSIYTSEEVARQEKDKIFMRQWLCVAREEEVANPGDYVSLRIAGEPVVVSRGKDGKVQAFMNMCLHRGVEVDRIVGVVAYEEIKARLDHWLAEAALPNPSPTV